MSSRTDVRDLVDALATATGQPKSTSEEFVNAFTDVVKKQLSKGKSVTLVGFGTFEVRRRQATTGRNPRTGAAIKIPAANQPKFKAGKALKEACN